MEMLEKVELVREKTGVSYDDAKVALDASEGDVLDAIIWLERLGKADTQTASYTTTSASYTTDGPWERPVSPEMAEAQTAYEQSSRKSKVGEMLSNFGSGLKDLASKGLDTTFVAERDGERAVALPVLFVVLGLFFWGASLWILIAGLFFGFRYHVEGNSRVTVDFNDVMDKAGEVADSIKEDVTKG